MGDLKQAINSGNEIMVYCDRYIGFKSDLYKYKLRNYFNKENKNYEDIT
jgi:hypothetical protein